MAKGLGKPIGRITSTRVDKVFSRLIDDICGRKTVKPICVDFWRFTWMYYLHQKSGAVTLLLEKTVANEFLVGTTSADIVPSD